MSQSPVETPNWALVTAKNGLQVQDNPWGALMRGQRGWSLDIEVPSTGTALASAHWDFPSYNPAEVQAYPEMIYGSKFGTTPDVAGSQFPKTLAECRDIKVVVAYEVRELSEDAQYNVALETFFHDSASPTGPGHPDVESGTRTNNVIFEMMVWLAKPDDPTMVIGRSAGTVKIQGRDYEMYTQGSRDNYLAFVLVPEQNENPQYSGRYELPWSSFALVAHDMFPQKNLMHKHISAFEFGPEIWTGEGRFDWLEFQVSYGDEGGDVLVMAEEKLADITCEHAHQLSIHHHQLSVHHNKIATLFEEIGGKERT